VQTIEAAGHGPDADHQLLLGIRKDALPAGRYASLVYAGVENGIAGDGALIDWAVGQGIEWDHWGNELGDAFGGRVEYMPASCWAIGLHIAVADDGRGADARLNGGIERCLVTGAASSPSRGWASGLAHPRPPVAPRRSPAPAAPSG
jgi:hypothetical protein